LKERKLSACFLSFTSLSAFLFFAQRIYSLTAGERPVRPRAGNFVIVTKLILMESSVARMIVTGTVLLGRVRNPPLPKEFYSAVYPDRDCVS
jgi:hypothetical protein